MTLRLQRRRFRFALLQPLRTAAGWLRRWLPQKLVERTAS